MPPLGSPYRAQPRVLGKYRLNLGGSLGLHGTLDEGLALEGELARACLSRFDAGGFGERRAMVMRRGKRQAT